MVALLCLILSRVVKDEMKVAIITSSVEPVGVATHVLNLACLLEGTDMLDAVICPAEGWLTEQLREKDLPYHVLNISYRPWCFISSNLKLFLYLKSRQSLKVVHIHGRFPLFVSLLSMITLKKLQFVVTVHQFLDSSRPGLFNWRNWLETVIWRCSIKKICCVSEALKREVIQRIGPRYADKVVVIKNWISPIGYDYNKLRVEAHTDEVDNEINVTAVGRLSPEKGFDILVEAINILVEEGVNVKCDIIGNGPEKMKLASMINERSLNNCIQLLGPRTDVRMILPKYDCLIVPSRTESFGIVVLEAYEAGIPVVASNIPGLTEIVKDGKSGLLFEPGNPKLLAQRIMMLINNPELADSFVRYGKELVKSYLPNNSLLKRFQSFYDFQDAKNY